MMMEKSKHSTADLSKKSTGINEIRGLAQDKITKIDAPLKIRKKSLLFFENVTDRVANPVRHR
jgi:hypothetical protein